jgi:hypothetical protein
MKEMKSVGLGEAILVPEPAATVIGPAIGNSPRSGSAPVGFIDRRSSF